MLREGAVDGGGVGAVVTATPGGGGVGSGGRAGPTDSVGEGVGAEKGGGDVGDGSGATAGGGTGSVRTSTRVEEGAAAGLAVRRDPVEVQAPRAKTITSSHALDRKLVIALLGKAAPEWRSRGTRRRRTDHRALWGGGLPRRRGGLAYGGYLWPLGGLGAWGSLWRWRCR